MFFKKDCYLRENVYFSGLIIVAYWVRLVAATIWL